MPRYVCDECGEVFESKGKLQDHGHESRRSRLSSVNFSVPDLTWKQFAVLGGVFLMATLFMGTVFFASSIGPSSPSSGGTTGASETSPPAGYTIQSRGSIPNVGSSELPSTAVSTTPMSEDVQLYLLTRPSVLLQYSCTDCPGTVENLRSVAEKYNSEQTWVYVAPYRGMDSRIALTAFQQGPVRLEEFDRQRVENFICSSLRQQPVQCAFR